MKQTIKKFYRAMVMFCAVFVLLMICPVKADAASIKFKAYYDLAKKAVNEANARYGSNYILDADVMDLGKQLTVDIFSGNYEWNVQMPSRESMLKNTITAGISTAKKWEPVNYVCVDKTEGIDTLVEQIIEQLGRYWTVYVSDIQCGEWYGYNLVGVLPMEAIEGADPYREPQYWSATFIGTGTLNPVTKSGVQTESLYSGATALQFTSGSNSAFADSSSTSSSSSSSTKKVTSVKITGVSKTLLVGKTMQLKATVSPSNASNKTVKWTVSNKKYATVSSKGVVKAKEAGAGKTVTITAKAQDGSGKKATYKIKIKGAVKKIKLKASKTTIKPNKKVTIKATVTVGKGGSKALKWTSSNTKYATVSSKGVVTAKKAGKGKTVTITARAKDGSGKKATIKIKIK